MFGLAFWLASFCVLTGNVLGALEIYVIRFIIPYLPKVYGYELLTYFSGGAVLYGLLVGLPLFLLCVLFIFGSDVIFASSSRRSVPLKAISMIIAIFLFYSGTKYFYHDFPGLFEIYRFPEMFVGAFLLSGLLYLLLNPLDHFLGLSNFLLETISPALLLTGVIGLNVALFLIGGPVFTVSETFDKKGSAGQCSGPPVILFGIDTLRADRVGAINSELPFESPGTDQLADSGVVYSRNHAQWGGTAPSFASLFTSEFPRSLRVTRNGQGIPDFKKNLVQTLEGMGYRTHAIVDSPVLHEQFFGKGFQTYVNNEDYGLLNMKVIRYATGLMGWSEAEDQAVQWLRNRRKGCFFLFVHSYIPHDPYHPPYPYSFQFDPWYYGKASGDHDALEAVRNNNKFHDTPDLRHIENLYNGEVAYFERQFARVIDTLKEDGFFEESLIILTADHGEMMTERKVSNWFTHGSPYQPDLHVPLIIKYPGNNYAGREYENLTVNLDIFPTIFDVIGRDVNEVMRGTSLQPENLPLDREIIFSQEKGVEVLREKEWKAIYSPEQGDLELYNLDRDPTEQENLIEEHPQRAGRYHSMLQQHYKASDGVGRN